MALDSELIYDWNRVEGPELELQAPPRLNDETLRDGLQSPSVLDPPIEKKIRILHLMDELGINQVNLGLPGAGPRAKEDVLRLAREIAASKLCLRANCAARTVESDIRPIADIVQAAGLEIEAATFLGSSPIRQWSEDWSLDFLLRTTEKAVKFATGLGLPVMYVTEDTTRARPEVIHRLYTTAIECGARAIVVCDTVGHVTPRGVQSLIRYVCEEIVKPAGGGNPPRLAWAFGPRAGGGECAGGLRRRRRPSAWRSAGYWRTRKEYAHGSGVVQFAIDGRH
jgi:2-isopropylmalate synthase